MTEKLTLTTPVPGPTESTSEIVEILLSLKIPCIKVTVVDNLGVESVYRLVPTDTVPKSLIMTALSFINQGKFKINQNKSLVKWLQDKMSDEGFKVGTVSGTET